MQCVDSASGAVAMNRYRCSAVEPLLWRIDGAGRHEYLRPKANWTNLHALLVLFAHRIGVAMPAASSCPLVHRPRRPTDALVTAASLLNDGEQVRVRMAGPGTSDVIPEAWLVFCRRRTKSTAGTPGAWIISDSTGRVFVGVSALGPSTVGQLTIADADRTRRRRHEDLIPSGDPPDATPCPPPVTPAPARPVGCCDRPSAATTVLTDTETACLIDHPVTIGQSVIGENRHQQRDVG